MAALIVRILAMLGTDAIPTIASRLSKGLGTKVPATMSGIKDWVISFIRENPAKSQVILAVIADVAGEMGFDAVVDFISKSEAAKTSGVVREVVGRYKSAEKTLDLVEGIVGDKRKGTVHGMDVEDYTQAVEFHHDQEEIIRRAVRIVGSVSNLRILRDAILTIEPYELQRYEGR